MGLMSVSACRVQKSVAHLSEPDLLGQLFTFQTLIFPHPFQDACHTPRRIGQDRLQPAIVAVTAQQLIHVVVEITTRKFFNVIDQLGQQPCQLPRV